MKIVAYDPNLDDKNFSKLQNAYLKLFNEKDSLKYISISGVNFDSRTITAFLKNSRQEEVKYYVALSSQNDIIGISAFKSDLTKGFEIIGTIVHKNHRFRGVGKALIDEGLELAKRKGYKTVDIYVFADNKDMLILLIKKGFKTVTIENHARFDGEDLIHLKKYF
jgi:ribosomal protein S18 acetylase RimI-like enzyme